MENYPISLLIGLLLVCSSTFGHSIVKTSRVKCTKPRGATCIVTSLSSVEGSKGLSMDLPDLSKRTTLKIMEGTLSNLTEQMASSLPVSTLWLEGLSLEAVFVAPNFEELHLRNNKLVALESDAQHGSTYALKLLDVRKNSLHNATQLARFHSLEELYLDENKLTELNMELFVHMTQLRVLSAARNGIVTIVPPTSATLLLSDLTTLSLAHNRLTSIEMTKWQLPSLQTLSLNHNNLTEVEGLDGFDQFYDLQKVELVGNPWSCGWLHRVLENAKIRASVNDPSEGMLLDASSRDGDCTSEKLHGICCSFTTTTVDKVSQPGEIFLPEINRVREAIIELDRRHEAFRAVEGEVLKQLNAQLQSRVDETLKYLKKPENELESGTVRAARIEQRTNQLEKAVQEMGTNASVIENVQPERKRLLHFMLDMKNKLLRQVIETDHLWVQAKAEKYDYERMLVESTTP